MDEIGIELATIRDEFNPAKESFLQRYNQSVQDWIAKHPQWGNIIAVPQSVKSMCAHA